MTHAITASQSAEPAERLQAVIEELGVWRVLAAAAAAMLRRRRRRTPDLSALNAHLRRDIGLGPDWTSPLAADARRPPRRSPGEQRPWDLF